MAFDIKVSSAPTGTNSVTLASPDHSQLNATKFSTDPKASGLDRRPLLLLSHAAMFNPEVKAFASVVKLGVVAKLKEAVGQGSATGDVQRAAAALERSTANAKFEIMSGSKPAPDESEMTSLAKNVLDDAEDLATALTAWVDRHQRSGEPVGTDAATLGRFKQALDDVTTFIDTLAKSNSTAQVRDALLDKPLPPGFPLNQVPALKAIVLDSATEQVLHAASGNGSVLRGGHVVAYSNLVKTAVVGHFGPQIDAARKTSVEHAASELKQNPGLLGLGAKDQLEQPQLRAAIAKDYQAFVTSLLGNSTASAREAAQKQPADVKEMTRHVKQAVDQAVREGKLTAQQGADTIRTLVANNIFIRGLNPQLAAAEAQRDPALTKHLASRSLAMSILMQQHANGIPFATKQPQLAELDTLLSGEKAKVDAFIDEVIAQL
ncbi:dsRNA-binding motif domain-containing protein [Horticoccus sp. 23ND18S-11]|uniref:hypothetical protein n=1 Tax=Horticoccus sp. 23ND18S-11 TaxID=3391832 RepID=UPI0039C91118